MGKKKHTLPTSPKIRHKFTAQMSYTDSEASSRYPVTMTFSSDLKLKCAVKYLAADPQWTSSHLDLSPADNCRCILCEIEPQYDSPLVRPAPVTQSSSGPQTMTPSRPSRSLSLSRPLLSCHSVIFWLVAKMIVAILRHSLLLRADPQGCCCCCCSCSCCGAAWRLWALKDIQNNPKSRRIKWAPALSDSCSHHHTLVMRGMGQQPSVIFIIEQRIAWGLTFC